jgi:hypothetical protein
MQTERHRNLETKHREADKTDGGTKAKSIPSVTFIPFVIKLEFIKCHFIVAKETLFRVRTYIIFFEKI